MHMNEGQKPPRVCFLGYYPLLCFCVFVHVCCDQRSTLGIFPSYSSPHLKIFIFMCVGVLPTRVYVCVPCVCRSQMKVSEVTDVLSCHVGAGNKNSLTFKPSLRAFHFICLRQNLLPETHPFSKTVWPTCLRNPSVPAWELQTCTAMPCFFCGCWR